MIQHSPTLVLVAWAGLIAAGCTWILPMLIVFVLSVGVAAWVYLR